MSCAHPIGGGTGAPACLEPEGGHAIRARHQGAAVRGMGLSLALAVLAAGCAASPPKPANPLVAANSASVPAGVTCRKDHVTGSLLPVQVCTTQAQRDTAQRSVQDYNDAINRSGNPPCIPGKTACQ